MIGEAGVPHDDLSYTGDAGDSIFSMQRYRNQALEFQGVMDAMDTTAQALRGLLSLQLPSDIYESLQRDLAEFESRKLAFRAAAETINAVGYTINVAGGRFPVLEVPQGLRGLGLGPTIPLAVVGAFAAVATLAPWGLNWIAGANRRLHDDRLLSSIEDPEQRAEAARLILQSNAALAEAESSTISKVATVAKWGLIALLAYYGYKMWNNR